MGSKKVVYIAGPISGVKEYWKAFEEAEDKLEAAGYVPLSPARLPWNLGDDKAMQICVAMINTSDAVCFLPGWARSVGAHLEMAYCKYTKKPYFELDKLQEVEL